MIQPMRSKAGGVAPGGAPQPTTPPPSQDAVWQFDQRQGKWAWVIPVVTALAGAYASRQQAQASNQPRTGVTNQTTTQNPYMNDLTQPDIIALLNLQRNLINQGPAQIGGPEAAPNYRPQPGAAPPPAANNPSGGARPGGIARPGGAGANQGPGANNNTKAGGTAQGAPIVTQGGQQGIIGKNGKFQPLGKAALAKAQGGGGAGAGGAGGGGAGGQNLNTVQGISSAVARAGMNAGNDPTSLAAQQATRNILAGQGGADSGTGYQHHNPINDALAQRLQSEQYDADELLRQFLGDDWQSTGQSTPTTSAKGYARYSATAGPGGEESWNRGGMVDSTRAPGTFNDTVKRLLDEQVNQADIQAIIDAQNADITRGMQRQMWDLDAASQGTGRFGGDMWAGLQRQARGDAVDQMGTFASQTRLGAQADLRDMYQNLLGQVNTRDIALMNDGTQRAGIAAAGSGGGGGNQQAFDLERRGQNLQALSLLMQGQQHSTGQLSGLGDRLSQDQLGAINQSQGLAGVNLAGLGQANNAASNLAGMHAADNQLAAARAAARTQQSIANAQLNQSAQMFNANAAQQQVDNYLRTLAGIGGMGGTSTTQGTNVVPGLGVNPTRAALQGALGGGLAGYGG